MGGTASGEYLYRSVDKLALLTVTAVILCFQSFFGLGMSGIRIQRYIIGNVFIEHLELFFISVTFFMFLTFHNYF